MRALEGLPVRTGWLRAPAASTSAAAPGAGAATVPASETALILREHGWRLSLDVAEGHKTGFYLDQRDNRALFARWVQHFGLQRVLNCYSYTGGFSVAALAGGAAEVTSVDSFVFRFA